MITTLPNDLITGHLEIDEQHLRFLNYIEELKDCCITGNKKKVKLIFVRLLEHVISHFAYEELLMAKLKYPLNLFKEHRQEHIILQNYYIAKFRPILSDNFEIEEVFELFDVKFNEHLTGADKLLSQFIQSQPLQIQP